MRNRDTFSSCHPVINFLYFALVLLVTMFCLHPVILGLSLAGSVVYAVYLNGQRAVRFSLAFLLPMMLLTLIINPSFNHQGITILTYLPTGNPLTLESILYGVSAAAMLAAVISWFSCYTAVMTSDKFVYLFGRVIPALSLVLSMTLRFVPKFKAQLHVVSEAQRCVGPVSYTHLDVYKRQALYHQPGYGSGRRSQCRTDRQAGRGRYQHHYPGGQA